MLGGPRDLTGPGEQRYPWWVNIPGGFTADSIKESQVPGQGRALCSMKAPPRQICCWPCSLGIPWGPVIISELESGESKSLTRRKPHVQTPPISWSYFLFNLISYPPPAPMLQPHCPLAGAQGPAPCCPAPGTQSGCPTALPSLHPALLL